ncbi:MAG: hypothetical protein K2J39_03985 [Ruminococcus sp.]|nr:hypothetical protein [Ruminococcus sp.]
MANMITSENEKFVDLSEAVLIESTETNGCLTIIQTANSIRLRLNKSLIADLGEPKKVKVFFTASNVIFIASDDNTAFTVKKSDIIYNTVLSKKVMELSGADFNGGSTKVGTYNLQTDDDGTVAAVVSF